MAEGTAQFSNEQASPHITEPTASFLSSFKIPSSPSAFIEIYGWYLLAAFLFWYFLWPSIKDKVLSGFPQSSS